MNETSKLDQLLGASRAAGGEPERHAVTLTLLAVDVVGSAGYFERQGEQGRGLLEQYERMGTRAVDGYGGRVVRVLGDTLLAEFSDSLLAVQAAVHLQRRLAQMRATLPSEEQIQLRMGVSQGACFRAGSDLFGAGVERCAAICKRAGPAQILISQEVREAAAGHREIHCMWLGAFRVADREENLFEVVWTEAGEYAELRHNTTSALRRGDLRVPGMQLVDLAQPEPGPVAGPTAAEVVGQRTGEFVPVVPPSLGRRYEIRGELGRGGMGVVYKAWDRETDELVALKVLRGEIATDETALVRFRNEVRTARRITHRNVCRIHDFNRTEDAAYISMEYIEGRSLRRMIVETGGLGPEQGIAIAKQICEGLAEAHRQGIVHRDLKPENVMVDGEGTVRLLDFGIARSALGAGVTQTGAVMGTPAYMAPEQAEGVNIDHRVDIYALGLILYEMFTGTPTFRASTPIAVVMKHIQEVPTPPREFKPNIPRHIEQTILRCLAKKPDDRFPSVMEVAAALEGRIEAFPAGMPVPESRPVASAVRAEAPPQAEGDAAAAVAAMPAATGRAAQAAPVQPVPQAARSLGARTWKILAGASIAAVVGAAAWYFEPWKSSSPEVAPSETVSSPAQAGQPRSQPPTAQPGGTGRETETKEPAGQGIPSPSREQAAGQSASQAERVGLAVDASQPAPAPESAAPLEKRKPAAPPPSRGLPPVSLTFAFVSAFGERKGAVNGITVSADGRLLATAGQDKTVVIWEANSGRQIYKLRGHTGAVLGVAFSGDGSRVASASADGTTRLWSTGSGTEERVLPKESAPVLQVLFSRDGQWFATSLGDGRIKLWEAATGAPLQNLVGHSGPVYSMALSADGRTLVSGGRDALVRVWSTSSGTERAALGGHAAAVSAVAVSADGRWVASGDNDGAVKVWDTGSGQEVVTLNAHSGSVDGLSFGPDGRWLITGGADKILRVWELPGGREVAVLERHMFGITDVAMLPGARWLASSDSSGTVMMWRWR